MKLMTRDDDSPKTEPTAQPPEARPDRLAEAFAYAADLHRGHKRKGTAIPYISHLMAVAALVQEYGGDEDQVIAALLHDGPEDRGGEATLAKIRRRFGERVARIVKECSDTFKKPKPPWLERKKNYLAHLHEASPETFLVSLADKVHNIRSITSDFHEHGDELWQRFRMGRRGTLWYYQRLLQIYEESAPPELGPLVGELCRSLDQLGQLIAEGRGRPAGDDTR